MVKVVFLGVGGGIPSQRRALPSVAIYHNGQILLLDCGEGTQIQLQRAQLSLQRITEIFISHLHGDHVLGLPGLLSSMALLRRTKSLVIFGPPGIKALIETTLALTDVHVEFELTIHEVRKGVISENYRYRMECLRANHHIFSLSFILRMADSPGRFKPEVARKLGVPQGPLWKELQQGHEVKTPDGRIVRPKDVLGTPRKGASIAYSGDTAPNPEFIKAAQGVSLLIHDATFTESHASKAAEFLHSTAAQAAEIAKKANAKKLALIHISPRYETSKQHEREAKAIFKSSFVPDDLEILELNS